MYICFESKEIKGNSEENRAIKRAIAEGKFIYYNSALGAFVNEKDKKVNIKGKMVIACTGINSLEKTINKLLNFGACVPNNNDDIKKIVKWFLYIEPTRIYIPFNGSSLNNYAFLTYLFEILSGSSEAFLKTVEKDFSGIIDLADLFDENSDLRKAFKYHEEDEFIISPKIKIDTDELGNIEYRCFVFQGRIMNISRITNSTYHQIPNQVLEYLKNILTHLPREFPKTFVVDVLSSNGKLDILEFNPYESSGRYLYNTIFEESRDLLHQNIIDVPIENITPELDFKSKNLLISSTLRNVPNSFAKDYADIKKFGDRINGFVHFSGSDDTKIDLAEILKRSKFIKSDAEL